METEKTPATREFFKKSVNNLIITLSIYEEVFYTGIRLLGYERLGIKNYHKLRKYIMKNGYSFAEDFLERFYEVLENVIILNDTKDIYLVREIAEKYNLLPNDALIAATCKAHGITKIATFDDDFKRIDFLKVVEV